MAIKYSDSFLSTLNDLTRINKSVIITKDVETNVVNVRMADPEKSMVYDYTVPAEDFDIESESIGFYNYIEFYQFFTALKNYGDVGLTVDGNKIVLVGENSKISFVLSDVELLKEHRPKNITFADHDYEFTIDEKTLGEITKMISLVSAKYIKVVSGDGFVTLRVYTNGVDTSFEKKIELKTISEDPETFEFDIVADQITKIPAGGYNFKIKTPGRIKVSRIGSDRPLDIFIARKTTTA